jgi:hypothetical protein
LSRKDKHSKGYAQTIHAIARAQQRYGLTLTRSDIMDLVRQIRDYRNGVEFVEKQSNRVSIFRVVIRGQKYPVAYDKSRGTICTFLPPEYEPGKWLAGFGRVDIQTKEGDG